MKIFLTGYPGFIGRRVVAALAKQYPNARFALLVQESLQEQAKHALATASLEGCADLLIGDLVEADLGLAADALAGVTDVWHLAAIYDLAVPEPIARRVNVDGTKNILDACERLEDLHRLVYFSTCYVAGKRHGMIKESELDLGQRFHNHYESTKFYAEAAVRQRFDRLPITIIRPAIVVGDSETGETDKYDGPYYSFRTLMRAAPWMPVPMVGPGTAPTNIVPVDFIVDASVAIFANEEAVGVTCHLADTAPLTIDELAREAARVIGRPPPRGRIPIAVASLLLRSDRLERALGLPRQIAQYLDYQVEFDTTNTRRLLEGTGIGCPALVDYLPKLIAYMRQNPRKRFLDGRPL